MLNISDVQYSNLDSYVHPITVIVKFIAPPPRTQKNVLDGFGRFEFEGVQNVQLLPTVTQLTNF